ncbi:TonB-dependent receptor, partial [Saprospiraceae bacterium]|nr:TonB-dependent receptor [Saprospiraceae bacterium]
EDSFNGSGIEQYRESIKFGFGWGNETATLRWNHLWTDKLFSNTAFTYSKYNFGTDNGFTSTELLNDVVIDEEEIAFGYDSGIRDFSAKIDFDYIPLPNHFIKFGANVTRHAFTPGQNKLFFRTVEDQEEVFKLDTVFGQDAVKAYESYVYVEDDIEITSRLKANIGLHFSTFSVNNTIFPSIQPRIAARYLFPGSYSLKASFATMQQNIQFLSNENIGLPWDQWLPTTDRVRPQTSWQAAIGAAKTFAKDYEVSVEAYYKEMDNVTAYTEGASVFNAGDWQDQVTQGDGRSYGLEVFLQKKTGKLNGWVGYTLSWSERRYDDKNFGRWYPFKFDRRHDISVVAIYELSEKINFSGTWVYGTGNTFTFPTSQYYVITQNQFSQGQVFPQSVNDISERNNYRLNPYHRADLNVDFLWGKKRFKNKLSVGAYNFYNRKNPFFLNPETSYEYDPVTGQQTSSNVLVQYSLFRLIPSIAYSFNF